MAVTINENLKKAKELLSGDREKEYGNKKVNHENIAKLWTAYLKTEVSAHDVAICMLLLKVARLQQGTPSADAYIDMVGYSAIAGEICE